MTQRGPVRDAIQWHEGMLLLPQHFQQMDRRIEQLISYHLHNSLPYSWGIIDFVYDVAAVMSGAIHIHTLEAVMPDGSIISVRQSDGEVLSMDLRPYMDVLRSKVMTLYVVIHQYQVGKGNATEENPRFRSIDHFSVVDENTGENTISMPVLKPNYNLMLSETAPVGFVSLPLLKIQRIENAHYALDYFPPQLKIAHNSPLAGMCRKLTQQIREKIIFLKDRLLSQTSEVMSSDTEDMAKTLCVSLLPLEAMIAAGVTHPYYLYIQLIQLASQLIAISPGQMPPLFKTYNHDDVRSSFLEVINFANAMLERIQEGYYVVPFNINDRTFVLNLNPQWESPHFILGAKASSKMSEKDVADWILQAVIATDNHVEACREKRVLGAARRFISGIGEMSLMPARDVVLFEVENNPNFINVDQVLQIFNVADNKENRPQELVLYIPKTEQT